MTDYTELYGPMLPKECQDDPAKWTDAFCQYARLAGHELKERWIKGWFEMVIEHSWAVRSGTPSPIADKVADHEVLVSLAKAIGASEFEVRLNWGRAEALKQLIETKLVELGRKRLDSAPSAKPPEVA